MPPAKIDSGKTYRKLYLEFCERIRLERGARCEACGRTARQAGQRKLHLHHLWPIGKSGLYDRLALSPCNVLLLCNYCHSLQHPRLREYAWDKAGSKRGAAL